MLHNVQFNTIQYKKDNSYIKFQNDQFTNNTLHVWHQDHQRKFLPFFYLRQNLIQIQTILKQQKSNLNVISINCPYNSSKMPKIQADEIPRVWRETKLRDQPFPLFYSSWMIKKQQYFCK